MVQQFVFEGIGTQWTIDHLPRLDARVAGFLEKKILDIVNDFDTRFSRFKSDSQVTTWSKTKGVFILDEDAKNMLDLYKKLYDLTHGAFTPLIGSVMEQAGYDSTYSLTPRTLATPYKWDEAIDYRYPEIEIKKPTMLDFGALGKGKLIDMVSSYLLHEGIEVFCIDAGGDLYYSDKNDSLRIGLEHPEDSAKVIGEIELKNESICASAGNRRSWGEFHHIIDPRTLASSNHILASWVVSKDAMTADALATCLFLVEPDILIDSFDFEYLQLYPDYSLKKSENFPATMYYTK